MTETMSGAVEERPPPTDGQPERSPPSQKETAHASRWTGGRIAALAIGALLARETSS